MENAKCHKIWCTGPFLVNPGSKIWFLSMFNPIESKKNGFGTKFFLLFLAFFRASDPEKKIHNVGFRVFFLKKFSKKKFWSPGGPQGTKMIPIDYRRYLGAVWGQKSLPGKSYGVKRGQKGAFLGVLGPGRLGFRAVFSLLRAHSRPNKKFLKIFFTKSKLQVMWGSVKKKILEIERPEKIS